MRQWDLCRDHGCVQNTLIHDFVWVTCIHVAAQAQKKAHHAFAMAAWCVGARYHLKLCRKRLNKWVFYHPEPLDPSVRRVNWVVVGVALLFLSSLWMLVRSRRPPSYHNNVVEFPGKTPMLHTFPPLKTVQAHRETVMRGLFVDGPEESIETTRAFAVRDVLWGMTAAALASRRTCVGGGHFATSVPALVFVFPEVGKQEGTWSHEPSVVAQDNVTCTTANCASWAFTGQQAVPFPEFEVPASMVEPMRTEHLLFMVNPVCGATSNEVAPWLERLPMCKVPIRKLRYATMQCHGYLLRPLVGPGRTPNYELSTTQFEVITTDENACCVQTWEDIRDRNPFICTPTVPATPGPGSGSVGTADPASSSTGPL